MKTPRVLEKFRDHARKGWIKSCDNYTERGTSEPVKVHSQQSYKIRKGANLTTTFSIWLENRNMEYKIIFRNIASLMERILSCRSKDLTFEMHLRKPLHKTLSLRPFFESQFNILCFEVIGWVSDIFLLRYNKFSFVWVCGCVRQR